MKDQSLSIANVGEVGVRGSGKVVGWVKGSEKFMGHHKVFRWERKGDQSSLTEYKGYYRKLTANKGDKITSPPPLRDDPLAACNHVPCIPC